MKQKEKRLSLALGLLLLAILFVGYRYGVSTDGAASRAPLANPADARRAGASAIVEAFAGRASGIWVESEGRVERVLRDDLEGSRHQRFIVRLDGGHTVLISHNIDLAPRVSLEENDRVTFRGEYEWNDKGGVVHWTHHDPQGRHAGGWIEHDGRRYE